MLTLVVLPGMDGSGELLTEFANELVGKLEIQIVSYPSNAVLGYEDLAAYVSLKLPTTRPFVLLGESFGGPLALMVAAAKPPGLVGVVLCASFAQFPVQSLRALAPLVRLAPTYLPLALLSWLLLGRWATQSWLVRLSDGLARLSPTVRRVRAHAALRVNVLSLVAGLSVPILCIRATEDRLVWSSAAIAVLAKARSGELFDVRAPHFVLQSAPRECAGAVESFARALGSN